MDKFSRDRESFRRTDGFVYRFTVGEHLLVALHSRNNDEPFFALTPTAADLWARLSDWATVDDLADALVGEYEIDRSAAVQDVLDFLEQLESLGAVDSRQMAV